MTTAQHFEAKLYTFRKSKDGTIISFVVQPHDVTTELQCLPIGARVMIAWSEIGDNERPVGRAANSSAADGNDRAAEAMDETAHRSRSGASPERPATLTATEGGQSKRRFADLPLSQQCAIRCGEQRFLDFLESAFWNGMDRPNAVEAAELVRGHLRIESRADLGKGNTEADNRWRKLETDYQQWLTDQSYSDQVRR